MALSWNRAGCRMGVEYVITDNAHRVRFELGKGPWAHCIGAGFGSGRDEWPGDEHDWERVREAGELAFRSRVCRAWRMRWQESDQNWDNDDLSCFDEIAVRVWRFMVSADFHCSLVSDCIDDESDDWPIVESVYSSDPMHYQVRISHHVMHMSADFLRAVDAAMDPEPESERRPVTKPITIVEEF